MTGALDEQWRNILLELLLAIGHELEVDEQLRQFLPVLLRKLACKAVAVFEIDSVLYQDYVLIKELPRNAGMRKYATQFANLGTQDANVVDDDVSGTVYAYALDGFGVLCIKHASLPAVFRHEMRQLCHQLSYALKSCRQHQKLHHSQRELDRFFELSHNLMCIIGPKGNFMKVNPAFCQTLRCSLDDAYTSSFLDFFHQDDREDGAKALTLLLQGTTSIRLTSRFKRKEQGYVDLAWDMAVDPATGHLYGTAMDVTQQKELQAKLQQAKQNAEQTAAAKAAFLANMSHEIRTPLNGVLGMLDLVMHQPLHAYIKSQLSTAIKSGNSLLSIVNDVLDFSKINSGQFSLEMIDFELTALVDEVITTFDYLANKKNLYLKVSGLPNRQTWLKGDPHRIKQVLVNLLGNALKFTSEGGVELRIDIEPSIPCKVSFSIIDTGIGLSSAQQRDLFVAFSQADGSTTRKYGGTGLGLAISKELVEHMQGTIEVQSELGQGAAFNVSLPLALGAAPALIMQSAVASADEMLCIGVLLVEDNEINREIAASMLQSFGCRVKTASTGKEAITELQRLPHQDIAIVLMDCLMPEMDGYEATRRIRAGEAGDCWQQVPILALTANAMPEDRERCLDAGMNDYLTKPFQRNDLETCIKQQLQPRDDCDAALPAPTASPLPEPMKSAGLLPASFDSSDELPVWNSVQFAQNFKDMPDLGEELLALFLQQLPATAQQLQDAQQNHNMAKLRLLAHSLKSSAAQLSFTALSGGAKQLEHVIVHEQAEQILISLEAVLRQVSACLEHRD